MGGWVGGWVGEEGLRRRKNFVACRQTFRSQPNNSEASQFLGTPSAEEYSLQIIYQEPMVSNRAISFVEMIMLWRSFPRTLQLSMRNRQLYCVVASSPKDFCKRTMSSAHQRRRAGGSAIRASAF